MLILVAILVILLLSYLKFRMGRRRLYELADKIPGIKSYPIIGCGYLFFGNSQDMCDTYRYFDEYSWQNGGYCKLWMGPNLYVVLTNPADIEILVNTCYEKGNTYKFARPWVGNGLIGGPASIWKRHRRMLAPTFNQRVLDSFIEVFWEQSNILIEKLRPKVGEQKFDVVNYLSPCTLDIICESAMGIKVEAQSKPENPYFTATMNEMKILNSRMSKIWLYPDFIFRLTHYYKEQQELIKILHSFTNNVITKKRIEYVLQKNTQSIDNDSYEPKTKTRKALLDLMMDLSEDGQRLTDAELKDEVDTIMVAGSDTTALTVSYVLVMIGAHSEVQHKIVEELNKIFGDSKRSVTKADLHEMEYLERVIKETLRKFPVVPTIVRQTDQELKLTSVTIPAGTSCMISIKGLCQNKAIWGEDVDEFDPDRFLPERSVHRHQCTFLPFSYGMRNCIGRQFAMMSMKVLLSTFLRHYAIKADPHVPLTFETILKPTNGLNVTIAAR